MTISEATWEKARLNQARRERGRLFKAGLLKFVSRPIVMVKAEDGSWKLPSLRMK